MGKKRKNIPPTIRNARHHFCKSASTLLLVHGHSVQVCSALKVLLKCHSAIKLFNGKHVQKKKFFFIYLFLVSSKISYVLYFFKCFQFLNEIRNNRAGVLEMHRETDIGSAPQRQSHLSERPFERLKAKSPATCQILWLTFQPGTCSAALSTCGCGADSPQTQLLEGILTVSFIAANNETGEPVSIASVFRQLHPSFLQQGKHCAVMLLIERRKELQKACRCQKRGKKTLLLFVIWNHFVG